MVSLNQSRRPYTSITFDVDMVDYLNESSHFDEIKNFFGPIKEVLEEFPRVRTTWFIRIDRQIEVQYGKPDFVFQEYPEVIKWLTGFTDKRLEKLIHDEIAFEGFFNKARLNPNAHLIKGLICGYRVEEIENPLTQKVRYLDKLVDELARGKKMENILRS